MTGVCRADLTALARPPCSTWNTNHDLGGDVPRGTPLRQEPLLTLGCDLGAGHPARLRALSSRRSVSAGGPPRGLPAGRGAANSLADGHRGLNCTPLGSNSAAPQRVTRCGGPSASSCGAAGAPFGERGGLSLATRQGNGEEPRDRRSPRAPSAARVFPWSTPHQKRWRALLTNGGPRVGRGGALPKTRPSLFHVEQPAAITGPHLAPPPHLARVSRPRAARERRRRPEAQRPPLSPKAAFAAAQWLNHRGPPGRMTR
jgi:hypothetical protein